MIRKLLAICAGLAVATALFVAGPQHITLIDAPTGDPALAQFIRDRAPHGAHQLAGFTIRDGRTTFAGQGADENTQVEIGSLTKTFNAELLRQATQHGTLTTDTKVGEIIDAEGELATVTLGELANHTAGLPRIAGTNPLALIVEVNPYGEVSDQDLFDLAKKAKLKDRGERHYSNLGAALLGQLLAKKAGTTWPELVEREIFQPLGMKDTFVAKPGTVTEGPVGRNAKGRKAAVWEMEGYAPAGGIRSTAKDMSKYVAHVIEEDSFDNVWIHKDHLRWHNGGTAGYSTMLVIDPTNKTASYVSNDTAENVNKLGHYLLERS